MITRQRTIEVYATFLGAAVDDVDERERKRHLARTDLFYLLIAVLGRRDLNRDWLFERCREVQAAPNGYLDLWFREASNFVAAAPP